MLRVHIKYISVVAFNSSVISKPRREASCAGLSFKGAAGCGWDHPGTRVSANVAEAAPCRARWDQIFPFVSFRGAEKTTWGLVFKFEQC